MWHAIILVAVSVTVTPTIGCIRRKSEAKGNDDGHYCVCNATYCDQAPDVVKPFDLIGYTLITSSKHGLRFNVTRGVFENVDLNEGEIIVNQTDVYQEIFGFGGAVTDSAAINIFKLSHEASDNLIRSYFGSHGINYNFIRTPMGATDFSTRPYTYAMVENDTTLSDFHLQVEDYVYKIPLIKRAQKLKKNEIKLLTVPWTASFWMKTNDSSTFNGKLNPQYRQLWADYFGKYFEAYRRVGLEFWGVSPQNEPISYTYTKPSINLNSMAWSAEEERDWIIEHLSPTLKRNGFGHIKIFMMDETRLVLPQWPKTVLEDKRARDIIFGIAIHFYFDHIVGPHVIDKVKQNFPEKSLIYTEACVGISPAPAVILGSWERGETYAKNIIETMSHWVSAWIDWNLALDMTGGPNWVKNNVDSPIIINSTADEFYKQPTFYALGHFSKYVPPNSMRIGTISKDIDGIKNIAFSTPDGGVVLIILNLNEKERQIVIKDPKKGITRINVPAKSINTMKYW